jgi:hypothetical protein
VGGLTTAQIPIAFLAILSNALTKRFVYLKLMEKNQNTDPFKFIIYSGRIGEQTTQISAERAK